MFVKLPLHFQPINKQNKPNKFFKLIRNQPIVLPKPFPYFKATRQLVWWCTSFLFCWGVFSDGLNLWIGCLYVQWGDCAWQVSLSLSLSLSLVRAFVPSRITLTLLLSYNSHSLSLTRSLHMYMYYIYIIYIHYIVPIVIWNPRN